MSSVVVEAVDSSRCANKKKMDTSKWNIANNAMIKLKKGKKSEKTAVHIK